MWYTLLTSGITALVLTFATSYIILAKTVPKGPVRKALLLFVIFTPFIAVVAFAKALFFRTEPIRYSEELGRIEDQIEAERARIFNDKIIHPSFSSRWRMSYLYAIEKGARAAAKLDPSLGPSFCDITQL